MKLLKHAAVGLVAMSFAGMASAQTTINITGSSAFRAFAHTAIMKLLGGTASTLPAGSGYGYTGSGGLGKANSAIFVGTYNSQPVIIRTTWTGSAGGVQTVGSSTSAFKVKFLPANSTTSTTGTASLTDPTADSAPNELAVPQMAFSDVYQASTPFRGTFNSQAYDTLVDNVVGVVTFQWVKSKGANAGITNMTPQLAQAQWVGTGTCPLALYTGNPADQSTLVYASGRDADSGTRISAFAETGIGNTTTVQQYDASTGALYAQQTVNGIVFAPGEGGEKSGGNLATKLGANSLTNSYVSYLSTGDAASLVTLGGTTLPYNGVTYTLAGVEEGQYTFWSYEHIVYKSGLAGAPLDFAEHLVTQLSTVDATPLLHDMHVTRAVDGGVVTADY